MRRRDWLVVMFLVAAVLVWFVYTDRVQLLDLVRTQSQQAALPPATTYTQTQQTPSVQLPAQQNTFVETVVSTQTPEPVPPPVLKPVEIALAPEVNLAVPFTPQAPTGNWKQPFQDGCEEASLLMVKEYYAGNTDAKLDATMAENAILATVDFEKKLFGFFEDTTAAQTAELAKQMDGLSGEVVENPTIEQIKTFLNKGEPVIVPAAGQLLGNPYFVAPGPLYHMLVIRGYTKNNEFITNDPGTKRGQAYKYSFDIVMTAMHDWNAKDILSGKKVILVLHP